MTTDKRLFKKAPDIFLERLIGDFINNSPQNSLEHLGGGPIFEEPLVGFADGDDPLFEQYKTIIGDLHISPREALEKQYQPKGGEAPASPRHVSVISWILPIARETRLGMRREKLIASLRWNHTRWQGEELNEKLSLHVVSVLEGLGHRAVAPMYSQFFKVLESPAGLTSNWSQRHAAYAAGLGTFSLSDGFITPRGIAHRCGSVVCDAIIPPTPRIYANHVANCLFYQDKSCRRCIERCPSGAISEQGHDKKKCREYLHERQPELLKESGRQGYIGPGVTCGLCQTRVPCEAEIPAREKKISLKQMVE